jgi:hypothetical protein
MGTRWTAGSKSLSVWIDGQVELVKRLPATRVVCGRLLPASLKPTSAMTAPGAECQHCALRGRLTQTRDKPRPSGAGEDSADAKGVLCHAQ